MRALLDVNVLIALLDAQHLHHEAAGRWLRANIRHGWATCPITQNGCLRIMAQSAYPQQPSRHPSSPNVCARQPRPTIMSFWPDEVSLLDPSVADWGQVIEPRQITDIYLLALAVERHGRFVTFDARIARSTVPGAGGQSLCVI